VADFLIICAAASERQVGAVASSVEDGLRKEGVKALGVEGSESKRWVLLDYGDVVVHVFLTSVREFYDLDGLWSDAPRLEFEGELAVAEGEPR
jgi:ribosome-associated protein